MSKLLYPSDGGMPWGRIVVALAAFFLLDLALRRSQYTGPLVQTEIPAPTAPISQEVIELWADTGITVSAPDSAPRVAVVAYREGIALGMRWMYGLEARPLDPSDHRLSSQWSLGVQGRTLSFELVVSAFRSDGLRRVEVTVDGKRKVLDFKPTSSIDPIRRSADLALEDLPKILEAIGSPAKPLPPSDAPNPLPRWAPSGFVALYEAVKPLSQPASAVNAQDLARGAYALAWQALLDHRLAPAAAPLRAAQSLAMASVASRRTSKRLPEAEAARWLAPGAATGDFWVLARTAPPAGFPELMHLHLAYVDPALPLTKPTGWALPHVIAATETALAINATSSLGRLLEWTDTKDAGRSLLSYLAQTDEFTCLAQVGHIPLATVFWSLHDVNMRGVGLSKSAAMQLGPVTQACSGARPDRTDFGAAVARVVPYAKLLMDEAASSDSWVKRMMLEEVADHALHGFCPVISAWSNYGWGDRIVKAMQPVYKAKTWIHPEIQWQLTDPQIFSMNSRGLSQTAVTNSLQALRTLPGLAHRTATSEIDQRVGGQGLLTTRHAQISSFADSPATLASILAEAASQGQLAVANALLKKLLREEGPKRIALYGQVLAGLPTTMKWELLNWVPVEWHTLPNVALLLSARLMNRAKAGEAVDLLVKALGRENHPGLGKSLLTALTDQKKFSEAEEQMAILLARHLPGLSRSTLMLALANQLLDAGLTDRALVWARKGKETFAAWAYTGHAMVALAAGQTKEALESIEAATRQYGDDHEFRRLRAVAKVVSTRGADGWPQLDSALKNEAPTDADDIAKILHQAHVPLPSTPLAEKLTYALKVHRLFESRDAPDPSVILGLVAQANGPGEVNKWCRNRLTRGAMWIVSRSLLRGSTAGQHRIFNLDEINALLRISALQGIPAIQVILYGMAQNGATSEQLVAGLKHLTPLLGPADQAIARVLTDGPRIVQWLAVTGSTASFESNLAQYALCSWLTGQQGGAIDLLKAVVQGAPGHSPKPQSVFMALIILGGSESVATKWLLDHGVKESSLGAWGQQGRMVGVLAMLESLVGLRPPSARKNLLTE